MLAILTTYAPAVLAGQLDSSLDSPPPVRLDRVVAARGNGVGVELVAASYTQALEPAEALGALGAASGGGRVPRTVAKLGHRLGRSRAVGCPSFQPSSTPEPTSS